MSFYNKVGYFLRFCDFLQVDKLVLIDASVYSEGTTKLPKPVAYAGVRLWLFEYIGFVWNHLSATTLLSCKQVYLLKSVPLRFYATSLTFNGIPFDTLLDWTKVSMHLQAVYNEK